MRLPNAEDARVDREKLTDYLLCVSHPDGASKAEFFARLGFRLEDWAALADALRRHGAHGGVVNTVDSAYGTRYAVDGPLETPDGRNPLVRTVWIVEKGSARPRLITAHPLEGPDDQGT